jgi:predicted XRE-type DNA-binding protein
MAEAGGTDANTVKEALASVICETIRSRGLTQTAAARLLEVAQPDVSDLVRGRLNRFSTDRLKRFLNALDLEIRIQIGPCPAWKDCAGITVEVVEAFAPPPSVHAID